MMFKTVTLWSCSLSLVATCAAAQTQDCPDLGFESAFLADHFCAQLQAIVPEDGEPTGTTRSITQEGNPDLPQGADWANFPLIQDAFRADPRKTLELIERIKGAGGLPVESN